MKTKIQIYEETIQEAKRFILKANLAVKQLKKDEYAKYGCKETATAKRASMDLTRKLVEIRKPIF